MRCKGLGRGRCEGKVNMFVLLIVNVVEEWVLLFGTVEAISDLHMKRLSRPLEAIPNWRRFKREWLVSGKWRVQTNISIVLSVMGGKEMGHHPEEDVRLRDGSGVELIIICLYANGNEPVRE